MESISFLPLGTLPERRSKEIIRKKLKRVNRSYILELFDNISTSAA
jgi:hypothetical protein